MSKAAELREMNLAVDALAAAMKAKLKRKAREGRAGGLDPVHRHNVVRELRYHVSQLLFKDAAMLTSSNALHVIDVCNLAMMLWVQGGAPKRRPRARYTA